jgi:hypothetical protein
MSIYSTVSQHNLQTQQADIPEAYGDPLVKLQALTEKGSTLAGHPVVTEEDSLAEYFSDDEEREKALQAQKKELKDLKLERDT